MVSLFTRIHRSEFGFSGMAYRGGLLALILLSVSIYARSGEVKVSEGDYIGQGGSGTLTVRRGDAGRLTFEISTVGGNCHICSMTGEISKYGVGVADSWDAEGKEPKCKVTFSGGPNVLTVSTEATPEACGPYCGARAAIDGTFRVPPKACTRTSRLATRDLFLKLYQSKRYSQAIEVLKPLLSQCEQFMHWFELDRVRSDLALAQYRSGSPQQCLETLDKTLVAKTRDEDELKSGNGNVYLPPCDFDNYIGVARTIWFNRALCSKSISR